MTCASFMQNVVNRCDFVNFSRLVNLLVRLKSTFEFLQDKSRYCKGDITSAIEEAQL